ncbi:hypothetical protein CHS0354_030723 [Potamilus streckersoni]|uniref:Uncharacterized protein n=1 Tax=Potamilus streckersoni TaxID=2493646 RepID=A0AAE0VZI0_9BIVA|nr:hypothetical protein CHS0354_030723 [Potamilus streckersoni]
MDSEQDDKLKAEKKNSSPEKTSNVSPIPQYLDLDECATEFEKWQEQEQHFHVERIKTLEEHEASKAENCILKNQIAELEKSLTMVQGVIQHHQKDCIQLNELENENRDLKSKLKEKNFTIEQLKKEIDSKIMTYETNFKKMEEVHKSTLAKQEIGWKSTLETKMEAMTNEITLKSKEVDGLKERIHEVEKEKAAEILRLSVDYENKLAKFQRQMTASSMNQQSSSSQEIFRKKLLHMKAEYEREITCLKVTVSSLQDKLADFQSGSSPKLNVNFGKKRKT